MSRVKEIADVVSDLAAIAALAVIALETGADPTTIVVAIAGLAGYKMRGRST
jgi:hypothetical protein